ncbi:MAG TPA: hypothetical protein VGO47_07855 [Chlamydiales bacterium]|jgi:RNA polymerase sigma-70 factor (ECF subfamily)|nr:hypothetical protein [Chlamydiales bacterium]
MSRNFTSDQVLIDRLSLDDTEAFEELYRRYWYSLYTYCVKKLQSPTDARQIVKTIFIDLWEKRKNWPLDFSISKHLYAEVRKEVVKCLSLHLSMVDESEMGNDIVPGFSAQALGQAKIPSIRKYTAYKPSELVRQQLLDRHESKQGKLENMKWLFQFMTAKLH